MLFVLRFQLDVANSRNRNVNKRLITNEDISMNSD